MFDTSSLVTHTCRFLSRNLYIFFQPKKVLTPQKGMHERTGDFDQATTSNTKEPWVRCELPPQASNTNNAVDNRLEDDKG